MQIEALILTAFALATPLLLAALGELVGEKAGVLNIGLEGQMLMGAWAGAAASWASGSPWLGIGAAMLAGVALSGVFAIGVIWLRADAIIVGTAMNVLALGVTGVLHRALISRAGNYSAPRLGEVWFWALGLVLVVALGWGWKHTKLGLQWRACGEMPRAAQSAGVNVAKLRTFATLFCGAMCGLGGAFLSLSHTDSFAENMTAGRGFLALALVIFGRWSPVGALLGALLFGLGDGAQFWLQSSLSDRFYPLLLALPSVLALVVLATNAGQNQAPQALGAPDSDA